MSRTTLPSGRSRTLFNAPRVEGFAVKLPNPCSHSPVALYLPRGDSPHFESLAVFTACVPDHTKLAIGCISRDSLESAVSVKHVKKN